MKPLIWATPEGFSYNCWMNYNWREIDERTNSIIFGLGRRLPCEDVGQIKCSLDPKEYDLIFASKVQPKVFKKFDCLPNNATAMTPLVNQKVLDIFNKLCPDDIQAFPATIVPEKGSPYKFENHDYWVINITSLVDALDARNTEFLYLSKSLGGDPYGIKKLVLNKDNEHLISRDKILKTFIIVSSALSQSFKEANITGVQFIEDKDYY